MCQKEYLLLSQNAQKQGLDAIHDICMYGNELAQQYLELQVKFGRNPFRNKVLNRESTLAE